MIFINHIKGSRAAKDYYSQHIAPGDYYGRDAAEMKGLWHGRGAAMVGLTGGVSQENFFQLCDNINPQDGKKLTARTKDDRRVLTDITFDAPKSVTLAYEMGGDNGKGDTRILTAMQESVRETMAEIEREVQTRVRKGGRDEDRTTGNIVWAEHVHRTTRPVDGLPDPQLHVHATVLNATFDANERKWKAVQLGDVVRDKGYYQAAFHARLAAKLKELGYGIEKDRTSFRLAGIDRATVEKFSRRSAVIESEAQRRGIDDANEKGMLGRRTREKKGKERVSMSALRAEWDARLTDDERLALRTASAGYEPGDAAITAEQAKQYALEHAFQNASAVSEKRLRAEALMHGVGSVTPDAVADLAQHKEAIPVKHEGQLFLTTKAVLDTEIAMLQFAKNGQRKYQPFLGKTAKDNPGTIASREFLAGLSEEQERAALHILNSRDQVVGVRGGAGTGKTHMLQTVNAVMSSIESGNGDYSHVYAFAQSSNASRGELAKVGFKEATTLAVLFHSEKMQAKLRKQVVLVDEAGLVSSKDMRQLFDIAKKQDARVILVGDYRQHASVEAGDAFRLIEKEAGVRYAQLNEIRRQTEPGYRKAVEAISQGSGKAAQKGFDALNKMGHVIEASGERRHRMLVDDYLQAQADGKSALIIAPTHSEGEKITSELRAALKETGAVGRDKTFKVRRSTGWSEAQKKDARNYEPGMVLEFHQNARGFARAEKAVVAQDGGGLYVLKTDGTRASVPLEQSNRFNVFRVRDLAIARGDRIRITKNGEARVEGQAKGARLNNGDVFTVEGFTKEGDIRLEKGRLLPKDWGHMQLGYVATSYASQGKTVDRVFIAAGKESLPATNQQQWYVSASRGREMAKLYVDSKKDVRESIARTGQRISAVELTRKRLATNWRERFYQTLERNRIGRFFQQRPAAIGEYWRGKEVNRG